MSKPSKNQIILAMNKLVKEGMPLAQVARVVSAYLVVEHRTKELDGLMRGLLVQRAKTGIYEAEITSTFALDQETKRALEQVVRSTYNNVKQIITHQQIDSSLIGGVRLESSDLRLDLTLRSKLQRLSQLTANEA